MSERPVLPVALLPTFEFGHKHFVTPLVTPVREDVKAATDALDRGDIGAARIILAGLLGIANEIDAQTREMIADAECRKNAGLA